MRYFGVHSINLMRSNHHNLDALCLSFCIVKPVEYIVILIFLSLDKPTTIESNFLTTILKWWNSWLGWKPSELLYLSVDRISQTCLPSRYGFIPKLKEKHQVKRPQVRPQEMHDSSLVVVSWIPCGAVSLCLSCLMNKAEDFPSWESRKNGSLVFVSTSAAKAIIRTSTVKNTIIFEVMLARLTCKSIVRTWLLRKGTLFSCSFFRLGLLLPRMGLSLSWKRAVA